jgi:DNA-binding NtrC family response regulator
MPGYDDKLGVTPLSQDLPMAPSDIILCVDDEPTVLKALRNLLCNTLGNDIALEIAESGQEALEICFDLRKAGRSPSVVISDYIMPHMRGDELLVRLHAQCPQAIKIMLTGQSNLEGVKRTINEANLYRFLEKPFNNADFVLTIKSALRAYAMDSDARERLGHLERENASLRQLLERHRIAVPAAHGLGGVGSGELRV